MISPVLSSALRGMQSAQDALGRRAESVARAADPESGVDLPRELVGTIEAKHAYAANAAVVRTADHMLGSLIDILA